MAKILVVDDSKLIVHVAQSILEKIGHSVLSADTGEKGLETALQKCPDLILLDLILPGVDGYEVCRRLKQNPDTADIAVIMVTSMAESADKVKGLEMGASDYVTKPFDEGELVARVNIHLRIKELCESLQEKNRQLLEIANRDGLTGLYNHLYFQESIANDVQRALRYNESLSLVMLDIDHFKKFNDTYGHQTGDMVLRTLGRIIQSFKRESDLASRYGGEEFAILLYHTVAADAQIVAERLRETVEQYCFESEGIILSVAISLGISSLPCAEITNSKTMIELADKALYQAKSQGRNRVAVYNGPGLDKFRFKNSSHTKEK